MEKTSDNRDSAPQNPEHARAQEKLAEAAMRIQPRPSAELLWAHLTGPERLSLGGEFEEAFQQHRTVGMLMKARGYDRIRATIEAAFATDLMSGQTRDWLLQVTSPTGLVIDDEIERLAGEFRLVVAENPRRVFWEGEKVEIKWDDKEKPWLLIWRLAVAAKQGRVVERDQFKALLAVSYLSKLKSRTTNLDGFPSSLSGVPRPPGFAFSVMRMTL